MLTYIELGAIIILLIAVFALMAAVSSLKKQARDDRKESLEFSRKTYESVNGALAESSRKQSEDMERLRQLVDGRLNTMQENNAKQLEKMRETVDEKLQNTLEQRLAKSFDSVRESLEKVYKGLGEMQGLAQGVGDLKKVLTNVKTRGIMGEIQLGSIIEQILAPSQYDTNVEVVPGSGKRVEFAVKLPGDGESFVYLPIDAKFPGDAYLHLQEAYESANTDAIQEARKQLLTFLKMSAKEVSEKYVKAPYTTEFAVMFLPVEGLYAEAVNMGFIETAQKDYKIMVAGPSTMAALLNSLQMGFKALAIQKNSGEVWKVLDKVRSEFDTFEAVLAKTQQKLTSAGDELDKLIGVRTRSIQRSLRNVQKLNGANQEDINLLEDID